MKIALLSGREGEGCMMLTARQYAQQKNVRLSTVREWLSKGWLDGVMKARDPQNNNSLTWFIPEDAAFPAESREGKRRKGSLKEQARQTPAMTPEEYISRYYCTLSISAIAGTLNISTAEVRAIADKLFDEGRLTGE